MATSAGTPDALIQAPIAWIDRLFPDPPRGERLKRSLADRFGGDSRVVTADVCAEVESVCRGGDPGTVALVLDGLLGREHEHLSDVIPRDHTRPWWTAGRPAELALPAATPVAALIGGRTYSSGDALALLRAVP